MSAKLVARRTVLKNIFTRTLQFTNAIPEDYSERALKVKLEELEKNYATCFEVHMQVMEVTGQDAAAFEEIEFEAIQNIFEMAKSKLLDRIDELGANEIDDADDDDDEGAAPRTPPARSEIKLPLLMIPPFSGDYYAWKSFRDLLTSAIGDRRDLTGAQKMHYLKTFLQGEAAQLVRPYNVTDGNYRIAWAALDSRYNNKRLLVNAHFKRLFGQPTVTDGSAHSLRQLLDTTAECVAALQAHELPTDEWDAILVYLVVQRLDSDTHKQWEISLGDNEIPTFADLGKFMERRCRSLEAIGASGSNAVSSTSNNAARTRKPSLRSSVHHVSASNPFNVCAFCDQAHSISNCGDFRAINIGERRTVVQHRRLCYICLKKGHQSAECKHKLCSKCNGRHHELLHIGTPAIEAESSAAASSSSAAASSSPAAAATVAVSTATSAEEAIQQQFGFGNRNTQVLLATAWVTIDDSAEMVRVLVDNAAHVSMIRESVVQRLRLQRHRVSVPINGIGGCPAGTAKSVVNVRVNSCIDRSIGVGVAAVVMPNLTNMLPNARVHMQNRPNFVGLQLADPTYYEPGDIDMVLGADVYGSLLVDGLVAGSSEPGHERPTAQNTVLGWILMGPISMSAADRMQQTPSTVMHINVEWDLRKFWQVEEVDNAKLLTHAESACEEHFSATHERDETGRYVVRLPFTTEPDSALGDSRKAALRRLRHIQRRLHEQPDLEDQYHAFMDEYAALGHMRVADRPAKGVAYYLPHHFVVKEASSTTRLRVVFDASCKTTSGRSLNDIQYTGPKLQHDLTTLVMRFRKHAVAITADIAKMYRQIRVHEDDQDCQRILWQGKTAADVQEFQLTTVTYGMAASPYLAIRALQQLAKDECQSFPRASQIALSDFYVDDLITGCDTTEDAIELYGELGALLQRGGFELRKWSSNSECMLSAVPECLRNSTRPLHLDEDASIKTLGLQWHPASDCFSFTVAPPINESQVTKRIILSVVARLFDPPGFLAPAIIIAKIIIQRLWTSGIDWDDEAPESIRSVWLNYERSLCALEKLQFPRWIGARDGAHLQFHGFADASEAAYGGVIYVRCRMPDGSFRVSLLTAKTKVAPLKQITLPRLELCAAALLAKLFESVKSTYGNDACDYLMWSDSQVALGWLRKEPRQWKTFVANRVSAIQTITTPDRWRHVRSADNPADCLSRGVMPTELVDHPLWLHGPSWLATEESEWPNAESSVEIDIDIDRRPPAASVFVAHTDGDGVNVEMQCWSSLTQLRRITALLRRFAHNCRVSSAERKNGHITTSEMHEGGLVWIRHVQREHFGEEIACCRRRSELKKSSKLRSLNPFLDEHDILRVGGRLRNARIPRDAAHPAIMPNNDHLTNLIIDDAHKSLMHGGAQLTLTHIRQRFWILGAKRRVRTHIHGCMTCYRQRPRCAVQQMGDLPEARVTPSRAFSRSGVDYAGPLLYKTRAGRGSRTEKGYIALFVCLATKAVHLEFVSDLSSDAFIAAFKRFVARRGRCAELLSDNATNFVGAKRKLNSIVHSTQHSEEVARMLANDGTDWKTIPPRSPHFGGLWEAGVKSVKNHLKRMVGEQLLTFEEFTTVLAQIEAILNSRPLCALTDDPDDYDALTPGHFLIGCAPTAVPDQDVTDVALNRLSRWQLLSQMCQHFWLRWHREYLTTLQQRYKWPSTADNVKVGQLVLLREENLPPAKWKMARVIGTQPGDDNRVRVVRLKHSTGETTRAIAKICILPHKTD